MKLLFKDLLINSANTYEFIATLKEKAIKHTTVSFQGSDFVIYEAPNGVTPLEILNGLADIENVRLGLNNPLAKVNTEIGDIRPNCNIITSYPETYIQKSVIKTLESWMDSRIHIEYSHNIPVLVDKEYEDELVIAGVEFIIVDDCLLLSTVIESAFNVEIHKALGVQIPNQYIKHTGRENILEHLTTTLPNDYSINSDKLYTKHPTNINRTISKFLDIPTWQRKAVKPIDTKRSLIKTLDKICISIGKGDIATIKKMDKVKVIENKECYKILLTTVTDTSKVSKYVGISISYNDPDYTITFNQTITK